MKDIGDFTMLIISSFKDFYDVGVAFGVDKKLVYRRTPALAGWRSPEVRAVENFLNSVNYAWPTRLERNCRAYAVGFCGKIYTGVALHRDRNYEEPLRKNPFDPSQLAGGSVKVFLGEAEFRAEAETDPYAKELCVSYDRRTKYFGRNIELFGKYENEDLFTKELKVPSFVFIGDGVYLNPKLSETGLQKMMFGIYAFAELSMFLAKLIPAEEMPPRTDVEIAQSKGFDDKSFRNRGSK